MNEEAGKLFLEDYSAYCSHARLFTDIHAKRSAFNSMASESTPIETTNATAEVSSSNTAALQISHAQNKAPLPSENTKPKKLVFGLGLRTNEGEDGENRPTKKRNIVKRTGKGALRRL